MIKGTIRTHYTRINKIELVSYSAKKKSKNINNV